MIPLNLDTDDCLLLADLLRSRIGRATKEKQSHFDITRMKEMQAAFRDMSRQDHTSLFIVTEAEE